MTDFLDVLACDAKKTINSGYYEEITPQRSLSTSLKTAIIQCKKVPIITEIKAASPSKGTVRKNIAPEEIAIAMEKGGATGISVLTEPKHFKGAIGYLRKVREAVELPILMKDIIISVVQLDAASKLGANAILLIQALFDRGYSESNIDVMIEEAHSRNLEVLLETHNENEFRHAIKSAADLAGINNRDLRTLKVNLNTTKRILTGNAAETKVVVSESGVNSVLDVRFLRSCGAKAFLIGSAIMQADNVEFKVKEFVHA